MSAFISAVYADRIELMADAAIVDDTTGALIGIGSKIHVTPGLPLAITGRGNNMVTLELLGAFHEAAKTGTVDGAIERFGVFLAGLAGREFTHEQDVLLAGWSETAGPIHRHAVIHGKPFGGPLLRLNEVQSPFLAGTLDDEGLYQAGFFADDFDAGLGLQARKLFEAWRKKPIDRPGDPLYGIGGQVHKLTLTKDGTRMETVGHWMDAMCEPIRPGRPMVMPVP